MELKTLGRKVKGLTGGEDRGVSPVIGVILMVAITVILAAVIGAFVLGLGDDLGAETNAGVSVTQDGTNLTVTWTSQGNANEISFAGDTSETATLNEVGASVTISDLSEDDTLIIIASSSDGTETVIREYTV